MIDDIRVLQMAMKFEMNPEKARRLLEQARDEPRAILERNRIYQNIVGGDTDGQEYSGAIHRRM